MNQYGLILFGCCCLSLSVSAELLFSEYIEGRSFNKALEIYNPSDHPVDLSNYTIKLYSNENVTAHASFTLSGILGSQGVYVIAHARADAAILEVANEIHAGTINFNGDDAITLEKHGLVIDALGRIGEQPLGSQWQAGAISTKDMTLRRKKSVTTGDKNPHDAFDPSLEWEGFDQDTLVDLGNYAAGKPPLVVEPARGVAVSIPEIQGAGHQSPLIGKTVKTTGLVTAVGSHAFYLQDPVGDGDQRTSDAILVYTKQLPTVTVGDRVEVQATVFEYIPGGSRTHNLSTTELISPIITPVSTGNALPVPVVIGQLGRQPPVTVIDNDRFSVFDPEQDGIDFYETLEAMYVTVANAVAVSPSNHLHETFVLADRGAAATGRNQRGGITISAADFNPERIQLQIDSGVLPGFDWQVSVGDWLGNVTGVVNYAYGNFEVILTEPVVAIPAGLGKESSDLVGDADHLSIASYNVQNLDPRVEAITRVSGKQAIDDDIGAGKFTAIATHIVNHLNSPDLVALQEVQDSDGAEKTDRVDADLTATTLIAAITAAGGPTYDYVDIPPRKEAAGGQPGGNIRVGFLYNPARIALQPASLQSIADLDLSDGNAFQNSRQSLYARFQFNGQRLHIINNHFASKAGSSPLFGQQQPPTNGGLNKRKAQAAVVNAFVDGLLATDSLAKIVVLGDLNEFDFEQPLLTLKGDEPVLMNLNQATEAAYSYIYQGNSQALDHVLVSHSLAAVVDYDIVHLNAEFQSQASDHDPLLLRLNLAARVEGSDSGAIHELFWNQWLDKTNCLGLN